MNFNSWKITYESVWYSLENSTRRNWRYILNSNITKERKKKKNKKEPSENRLRINCLGRRKRLLWGSNVVGLSRFIVAMNGVSSHIERMEWMKRINNPWFAERRRWRKTEIAVFSIWIFLLAKGYEKKKLWWLLNEKKCDFKGCTSRWGFHQTLLHAQ